MLEPIRAALSEAIRAAAKERLGSDVEKVVLERPPKLSLGDYACPVVFDLAKALKKAPRSIAAELAQAVRLPAGVREARVEGGGYLNFFLDRGPVIRTLLAEPSPAPPRPEKIIVEHTNINPNKAAHIGHLRNAVLGDVLVRALRHLGYPVEV
jgi:arginyl-tRNA synthetase